MERSVLVVSVIINNSLHLKLLGASFCIAGTGPLHLEPHLVSSCHQSLSHSCTTDKWGFFLAVLRKTLFWVLIVFFSFSLLEDIQRIDMASFW